MNVALENPTAMASDVDAETLFFDRERAPYARIVVRNADGSAVSKTDGAAYEAALRTGIARMVRKARRYMAAKDGEGTHWTELFGGRVIYWALSLKPASRRAAAEGEHPILRDTVSGNDVAIGGASAPPRPSLRPESNGERENDRMWSDKPGAGVVIDHQEISPAANAANDLAAESPSKEITPSDPIVRALCEANRARKTYPAGHTFSMTNPIQNGQMVTLGSCKCGETFSYPYGKYGAEMMDAAIEAHRQKFDHLPEKIDGMGRPIGAKPATPKPAKPRKRKVATAQIETSESEGDLAKWAGIISQMGSQPPHDAGGQQPASEPAPRLVTSPGAGEIQPAQICAASDPDTIRRAALADIAAGREIDGQIARDLIGEGLVHATTTRLLLTEEGEVFLNKAPAPGPSKADRVDWDALIAMIYRKPVDEIVASDMVTRGLAFVNRPGEWIPTKAGFARAEGLKPFFWVEPTNEEIRARMEALAAEPAQNCTRVLPKSDDPEFMEWKALAAIEAHVGVTGPLVQDLIDRGLVVEDFVDGTLVVTDDEGVARLAELEARFNPPPVGEPAPADEYLAGIMARNEEGGGVDGACSASERGENRTDAGDLTTPADAPEPVAADQHSAAKSPGPALSDDDDLAIDWPSYDAFLEDKIVTAPMRGIEVMRDELHPWLKPHCKDLVVWALRLGCAAIFANFGLHKTAMQLEWCRQLHRRCGGATLNVVPLGVRHGFIKEAVQLDMDVRFIRTTAEFDQLSAAGEVDHFLTNYESIREGKLDVGRFTAVSLDEASVLRSYGSKTFQEFLPLFKDVPFKLVATATPSPNRYKELIHYAGFLGVMDTGLALTRWFQRNSEKAGDLTLYPHKEAEFWMFIHSFCAFLQRPSELGHSDDGYELPPLKLTWHEVPADHSKAEPERDGQGVMFRDVANSLSEAAKARRDSLAPRIAKMTEIIAQAPDATWLIWHDLDAERDAIKQALPDVVTITGSMLIDDREILLHDFEEGRIKQFATKPILSGSGSNFQYHCHHAIYLSMPGYGYKFNDFIQSLYRLQRFGQQHLVEVHIIHAEDERAGRAALQEKWARDTEMRLRMSEIILAHGLNTLPLRDAMLRTMGIKRVEVRGSEVDANGQPQLPPFICINNDSVAECRAWPENSVDLFLSSIPFGKQYEYSASYRDFGHSDDNAHFWSQMDFLSTELLRMLKPGRLACIHVKDRILFGAVTGEGVPTVEPFHAEAIMHYRAHGFQYMGMITVVTDVVRENNQTYRLGWSEMCKDGTKMGVGMPEYILLLRKRQSDRSRGYADVPVTREKKRWVRFEDGERKQLDQDQLSDLMDNGLYTFHQGIDDELILDEILPPDEGSSRARWQIDAHGFWRSSGNRLLTAEEFAGFSSADLARAFAKTSAECVYDYEAHVKIGEVLERAGTLPATFMAIVPGSRHHAVWTDVQRMRTLNMMQQRKGAEQHLCPLPFDIVDRLIKRYSNEGDLVFDPFGGLGTVAYRAQLKKRRGAIVELSPTYFLDAVHYAHMAEEKMAVPEMFDLAALDAANTPPPSDVMEIEAHG